MGSPSTPQPAQVLVRIRHPFHHTAEGEFVVDPDLSEWSPVTWQSAEGCEHWETMCPECHASWAHDWEVRDVPGFVQEVAGLAVWLAVVTEDAFSPVGEAEIARRAEQVSAVDSSLPIVERIALRRRSADLLREQAAHHGAPMADALARLAESIDEEAEQLAIETER